MSSWTGPSPSAVATEEIAATPTSSRLASRSVPRKASHANIGITANTSGGADP